MVRDPVRICHVITTLDVGGAELMLARLVEHMDGARFRNAIVSLVPVGEVGTRLEAAGFTVTTLNMQRGRPSARALARLVQLLVRERPAILQTWLYHADVLGLIAGRLARVPAILWNVRAANMDLQAYRRLSGLTFKVCRALSSWPDGIVVNSHAGRAYHERAGFRARRWFMVANGIDTAAFAPDPLARAACRSEVGASADTLLIGFVARLDPMKDHDTFIEAARIFARQAPEARFLLAGAGVTRDNRDLAMKLESAGIADRTVCLGQRRDIARVTAALDIASSCSKGEGFPNVVAEAMSCGVPCVVTDVGDSARIIGDTGLVVPVQRPDLLAAAWQKLRGLGAPGRAALGTRARVAIVSQYSLSRAVTDYQDLYSSLAAGIELPVAQA